MAYLKYSTEDAMALGQGASVLAQFNAYWKIDQVYSPMTAIL